MNIESLTIEAHVVRKARDDYEFLLLKRSGKEIYPGLWQMVTGKIKEGEKAYETALRELQEETGLTPLEFWVAPKTSSFYYPEKDTIYLVPVFIVLVNENSDVRLSDEHSEYEWVSKKKAIKLLPWKEQQLAVKTIYNYLCNEKDTLEYIKLSF